MVGEVQYKFLHKWLLCKFDKVAIFILYHVFLNFTFLVIKPIYQQLFIFKIYYLYVGLHLTFFSDGKPRPTENCSRNFITFTDERLFHKYFPRKKPQQPATKYQCPITGLPAKYFDPVTRSPYANIKAFKLLREAYQQRLETLSIEKQAADASLEGNKRRSRAQLTPAL